MAKFVVNSTLTCALRLEDISKVEIVEKVGSAGAPSTWWVSVSGSVKEESFEIAASKEAAQALATPILTALEA